MKGVHHIIIETGHIRYEFDIRRNITVIQGDSATGKTTLIGLLREYALRNEASGILLQSDVDCEVYGGTESQWKVLVETYQKTILFFDEGYDFIFTKEFAESIQGTDNYYVFVARKPLRNLPYSVNEIYGIRTTGKYHFPEKVYHEFYPLYSDVVRETEEKEWFLLVEDEKAGYQFFSSVMKENCKSVSGNTGFYHYIREYSGEKKIAVIADGAAFGAFVAEVLEILKRDEESVFYLPESFEWMILKSGVVSGENIKEIIEHPEGYIDGAEYFTWERFFTDYLREITWDNRLMQYHKNRLPDYYMQGQVRSRILSVLPKELQEILGKS